MALHIQTPLLLSSPLSNGKDRRVWLKMEALQPPGSFKIRGIGHACEWHARAGKRRFVSSSGGNAGLAVAYAGRQLGVAVTVVVPVTTSERARRLILSEGASLVVHGAAWPEANARALELIDAESVLIHPFDDPLLWEGHASLIDELEGGHCTPDLVVLSVGGGGLLGGVLRGLERHGWGHVPIAAVETTGTASLAASLKKGTLVEIPRIEGVATSLGARQVSGQVFDMCKGRDVISVVVTDRQAVSASRRFLDDHRVFVEPACGAALALAYDPTLLPTPARDVLFVVCGGATASVEMLDGWLASMEGPEPPAA